MQAMASLSHRQNPCSHKSSESKVVINELVDLKQTPWLRKKINSYKSMNLGFI